MNAGPRKGRTLRKKTLRLRPSRTSFAALAVPADIEDKGTLANQFLRRIRLQTVANSAQKDDAPESSQYVVAYPRAVPEGAELTEQPLDDHFGCRLLVQTARKKGLKLPGVHAADCRLVSDVRAGIIDPDYRNGRGFSLSVQDFLAIHVAPRFRGVRFNFVDDFGLRIVHQGKMRGENSAGFRPIQDGRLVDADAVLSSAKHAHLHFRYRLETAIHPVIDIHLSRPGPM